MLRTRHVRAALIALAFHAACPPTPVLGSTEFDTIYWTDRTLGTIQRADLGATYVETIASGLPGPQGIAIDTTRAKIFWADSTLQSIHAAELDGANAQAIVQGLPIIPTGISVDPLNEMVYWCDPVSQRIQRCAFDGSGVEDVLVDLLQPLDVAFDPVRQRVYWASGANGIFACSLAQGSIDTLTPEFAGVATTLALTPDVCRVYWAASSRFSYTATITHGITLSLPPFLTEARGIAIEPQSGDIFWAEGDAISRTNAAGQNPVVIISGLPEPWRLTLGPAVVAPTVLAHPESLVAPRGTDCALTVEASGSSPMTYTWRRDSVPLEDTVAFSGVSTPHLTISIGPSEVVGVYDCVITNPVASVVSDGAVIGVRSCEADVDANGTIDAQDLAKVIFRLGDTCP